MSKMEKSILFTKYIYGDKDKKLKTIKNTLNPFTSEHLVLKINKGVKITNAGATLHKILPHFPSHQVIPLSAYTTEQTI